MECIGTLQKSRFWWVNGGFLSFLSQPSGAVLGALSNLVALGFWIWG